jgi:hypothetical protein
VTVASKAVEGKLDVLFRELKGENPAVPDPIIDDDPIVIDANAPIAIDGGAPMVIDADAPVIIDAETPPEADERLTNRQAESKRRLSLDIKLKELKREISVLQSQLAVLDVSAFDLDGEASILQEEEDAFIKENERLSHQTGIQCMISWFDFR